jgi:hypothetical protein
MDASWLAKEAHQIHGIFEQLFYSLIAFFLILGVVLEYFKLPLGGSPAFLQLVGRVFVAAMMLVAFPEISNFLADLSDSLAQELGDVNNFHLILNRMGDKLQSLSASWVSVKDVLILSISFLTFFILYIAVYFADACFMYAWTLLYVFSPLLIALFVFPATASATKGLFRSLIEVSCWKCVWSVMATLLWSLSVSDINGENHNINFLSAIVLNLLLAFSILVTPMLVRALARGTVGDLTGQMGGLIMGAAALTPTHLMAASKWSVRKPISTVSKQVARSYRSSQKEKGTI